MGNKITKHQSIKLNSSNSLTNSKLKSNQTSSNIFNLTKFSSDNAIKTDSNYSNCCLSIVNDIDKNNNIIKEVNESNNKILNKNPTVKLLNINPLKINSKTSKIINNKNCFNNYGFISDKYNSAKIKKRKTFNNMLIDNLSPINRSLSKNSNNDKKHKIKNSDNYFTDKSISSKYKHNSFFSFKKRYSLGSHDLINLSDNMKINALNNNYKNIDSSNRINNDILANNKELIYIDNKYDDLLYKENYANNSILNSIKNYYYNLNKISEKSNSKDKINNIDYKIKELILNNKEIFNDNIYTNIDEQVFSSKNKPNNNLNNIIKEKNKYNLKLKNDSNKKNKSLSYYNLSNIFSENKSIEDNKTLFNDKRINNNLNEHSYCNLKLKKTCNNNNNNSNKPNIESANLIKPSTILSKLSKRKLVKLKTLSNNYNNSLNSEVDSDENNLDNEFDSKQFLSNITSNKSNVHSTVNENNNLYKNIVLTDNNIDDNNNIYSLYSNKNKNSEYLCKLNSYNNKLAKFSFNSDRNMSNEKKENNSNYLKNSIDRNIEFYTPDFKKALRNSVPISVNNSINENSLYLHNDSCKKGDRKSSFIRKESLNNDLVSNCNAVFTFNNNSKYHNISSNNNNNNNNNNIDKSKYADNNNIFVFENNKVKSITSKFYKGNKTNSFSLGGNSNISSIDKKNLISNYYNIPEIKKEYKHISCKKINFNKIKNNQSSNSIVCELQKKALFNENYEICNELKTNYVRSNISDSKNSSFNKINSNKAFYNISNNNINNNLSMSSFNKLKNKINMSISTSTINKTKIINAAEYNNKTNNLNHVKISSKKNCISRAENLSLINKNYIKANATKQEHNLISNCIKNIRQKSFLDNTNNNNLYINNSTPNDSSLDSNIIAIKNSMYKNSRSTISLSNDTKILNNYKTKQYESNKSKNDIDKKRSSFCTNVNYLLNNICSNDLNNTNTSRFLKKNSSNINVTNIIIDNISPVTDKISLIPYNNNTGKSKQSSILKLDNISYKNSSNIKFKDIVSRYTSKNLNSFNFLNNSKTNLTFNNSLNIIKNNSNTSDLEKRNMMRKSSNNKNNEKDFLSSIEQQSKLDLSFEEIEILVKKLLKIPFFAIINDISIVNKLAKKAFKIKINKNIKIWKFNSSVDYLCIIETGCIKINYSILKSNYIKTNVQKLLPDKINLGFCKSSEIKKKPIYFSDNILGSTLPFLEIKSDNNINIDASNINNKNVSNVSFYSKSKLCCVNSTNMLEEKDYFGYKDIVNNLNVRTNELYTVTECLVFCIKKDDLYECIKKYSLKNSLKTFNSYYFNNNNDNNNNNNNNNNYILNKKHFSSISSINTLNNQLNKASVSLYLNNLNKDLLNKKYFLIDLDIELLETKCYLYNFMPDIYEKKKFIDNIVIEVYFTGEKIINKNEQNYSLYIVAKGEVSSYIDKDIVNTYTQGNIFGYSTILYNDFGNLEHVSSSYTILYNISYNYFYDNIKQFEYVIMCSKIFAYKYFNVENHKRKLFEFKYKYDTNLTNKKYTSINKNKNTLIVNNSSITNLESSTISSKSSRSSRISRSSKTSKTSKTSKSSKTQERLDIFNEDTLRNKNYNIIIKTKRVSSLKTKQNLNTINNNYNNNNKYKKNSSFKSNNINEKLNKYYLITDNLPDIELMYLKKDELFYYKDIELSYTEYFVVDGKLEITNKEIFSDYNNISSDNAKINEDNSYYCDNILDNIDKPALNAASKRKTSSKFLEKLNSNFNNLISKGYYYYNHFNYEILSTNKMTYNLKAKSDVLLALIYKSEPDFSINESNNLSKLVESNKGSFNKNTTNKSVVYNSYMSAKISNNKLLNKVYSINNPNKLSSNKQHKKKFIINEYNNKINYLKNSCYFNFLTNDYIKKIASKMKLHTYRSSQFIYKDISENLYLIIEGLVRINSASSNTLTYNTDNRNTNTFKNYDNTSYQLGQNIDIINSNNNINNMSSNVDFSNIENSKNILVSRESNSMPNIRLPKSYTKSKNDVFGLKNLIQNFNYYTNNNSSNYNNSYIKEEAISLDLTKCYIISIKDIISLFPRTRYIWNYFISNYILNQEVRNIKIEDSYIIQNNYKNSKVNNNNNNNNNNKSDDFLTIENNNYLYNMKYFEVLESKANNEYNEFNEFNNNINEHKVYNISIDINNSSNKSYKLYQIVKYLNDPFNINILHNVNFNNNILFLLFKYSKSISLDQFYNNFNFKNDSTFLKNIDLNQNPIENISNISCNNNNNNTNINISDRSINYNNAKYYKKIEAIKFWSANALLSIRNLHSKRIIHRDIRSENFKINIKGYLYLSDYSNAKCFNNCNIDNIYNIDNTNIDCKYSKISDAYNNNNLMFNSICTSKNSNKSFKKLNKAINDNITCFINKSKKSFLIKDSNDINNIYNNINILEKLKDRTRTILGNPYYLSPEIIKNERGYSYYVDYWSFGVMLYNLATSSFPFGSINDDPFDIYKNILKGSINLNHDILRYNVDLTDLLTKLLDTQCDEEYILNNKIKNNNYIELVNKTNSNNSYKKSSSLKKNVRLTTFKQITNHKFYSDINFNDLENLLVKAPVVPTLEYNKAKKKNQLNKHLDIIHSGLIKKINVKD